MSRSKLSLPFSQACKLKDDQKCKLIECQARRIAIEEWEIKAMLDVCLSNGWLDKGLAVLYEYAGHLDDLKKAVEQRTNCVEDVIDYVLSLTEQHGLLNLAELIATAEKAAYFTNKSIHILCVWRRLQCCPKPVFVEEKMGGKWSFQFLLKDEAKRFSDALFQSLSFVNIFDLVPLENIVAILAPFMDFDNFVDLMKYQQKYCAGRYRNKKTDPGTGSIDVESLTKPESPVRALYLAIREVVGLEDKIDASWDNLRSLPLLRADERSSGSGRSAPASPDPSKLFPTLRLPYRNFRPPTSDLAWFVDAVPRYLELDAVISACAAPAAPTAPTSAPFSPAQARPLSKPRSDVNNNDSGGGGSGSPTRPSRRREQTPAGFPSKFIYSALPYFCDVMCHVYCIFCIAGDPGTDIHASRSEPSFQSPPAESVQVSTPFSPSAARPIAGPAGAAFARSRSNQKVTVSPGSRKWQQQTATETAPERTIVTEDWYNTTSSADQPGHLQDLMSASPTPARSPNPMVAAMVLPSRGNNAEQDTVAPSNTIGSAAEDFDEGSSPSFTAAAAGLPFAFVDPSLRKRSVTVAVVGHPDPALTSSKDGADLKRRVTHAGNISAAASFQHFHQQQQSQQSTSLGGSVVNGAEEPDSVYKGAAELEDQFVVPSTPTLLPIEESTSTPAAAQSSEECAASPAPLTLRNPSDVDTGNQFDQTIVAPIIDNVITGQDDDANLPVTSEVSSPTPIQPSILKQSSFSSDGGSTRKPSQMLRVASEGRCKTLSFDSNFEDDSVFAASSPTSGAGTSRPRNGSYEILYQETPEERLQSQQMQPAVVFQATPSPHLSRKRAQSTPLNLLSSSQPNGLTNTSSANVISPAPIHVSPSLNMLSYYPTFAEPAAGSPEARLRSAPAQPVRKVYRGRESKSSTPSPNQRKNFSASKLFSARNSRRSSPARVRADGDETEEGDPHFMETFGMLDTLSKPFTRGESMAESQVIHIALRNMRVEGSTLLEMAARKISVWWRLVAPRKKLLRRMALREQCKDIIYSMADSAVLIGITKQRRHRSLLRNGAAMKIQRCFRYWSNTILVEERRVEQLERSRVAWQGLSLWSNCVMAAIRIFRYVRYCQRRRRGRKIVKMNASQLLRRTIDKYFQIRTLRKKLELQQQLYTKMKITSMMSNNNLGRHNLYRERELAVACIQKAFRSHMLHRQLMERQYFNIMGSKITYFFIRCIARRRVKINKAKKLAATVIQTFFRGIHTRRKILKIVESGLLLNALWRKHKAYVSLKSQLRRVDRPHTLVLHGIRNISKKTINSDQMRFKVSVWWHPLLHIVSQNDFNTIIQSKQPQFIYNSEAFYLIDTAEQKPNRRMSISQGLRKLSSILTTNTRRQSTLGGPVLPPVNTSAKGVFRYSQVLANKSNSLSATARASMASFVGAVTSRQSTYIKPLPSIPSKSNPSSFASMAPIPSSVGAIATAGPGAQSKLRKESVEVLRPSALAAQLDIIHSDDEEESDDDDEADNEASPKPKLLPSRSFLANRMGLPTQRNSREGEGSSGKNSPSPVPSAKDGTSEEGQDEDVGFEKTATAGSSGEEGNAGSRKASSSWRRISAVVKNTPDLLLDPNSSAENSPMREGSDGGDHSPKPSSIGSNKTFGSATSNTGSLLLRSTLNFMSRGASARSKQSTIAEPKMICHFEDDVIKIPGCHGNSVIKFEIFEGE